MMHLATKLFIVLLLCTIQIAVSQENSVNFDQNDYETWKEAKPVSINEQLEDNEEFEEEKEELDPLNK